MACHVHARERLLVLQHGCHYLYGDVRDRSSRPPFACNHPRAVQLHAYKMYVYDCQTVELPHWDRCEGPNAGFTCFTHAVHA